MYRTYPNRYPAFEELKTFFKDTTTLAFHEEIIHKFTERIKSIPQIECIMLIGSLGNDEGDIFSDIDFAVIHNKETSYSSTLRDIIMENILKSDDVLYYYTSGFENRIIFIKPLIKFELIVRTIEAAGSRWKYAKAKILYDKTGIGESIKERANTISFPENLDSVIGNKAVFLPTMFYLASASVVRGEFITALDGMDWIRNEMLGVCGWLLDQWDEGPRRAERRFPLEVLSFYRNSRVSSAEDIFDALLVLMDWYEKWMVPRFDERNIQHSEYQIGILRKLIPFLKNKKKVGL